MTRDCRPTLNLANFSISASTPTTFPPCSTWRTWPTAATCCWSLPVARWAPSLSTQASATPVSTPLLVASPIPSTFLDRPSISAPKTPPSSSASSPSSRPVNIPTSSLPPPAGSTSLGIPSAPQDIS